MTDVGILPVTTTGSLSPSTSTAPNDAPAVISEKRNPRLYSISTQGFSRQSRQPSTQIHLCRLPGLVTAKVKQFTEVCTGGKTPKSPFAQPLAHSPCKAAAGCGALGGCFGAEVGTPGPWRSTCGHGCPNRHSCHSPVLGTSLRGEENRGRQAAER